MELKARGSFYRDLSHYSNHELATEVDVILRQIIKAKSLSQIPNLKKLRKFEAYYRIKIMENYRIGMQIHDHSVILVCFGHRHTFYKSFP